MSMLKMFEFSDELLPFVDHEMNSCGKVIAHYGVNKNSGSRVEENLQVNSSEKKNIVRLYFYF